MCKVGSLGLLGGGGTRRGECDSRGRRRSGMAVVGCRNVAFDEGRRDSTRKPPPPPLVEAMQVQRETRCSKVVVRSVDR